MTPQTQAPPKERPILFSGPMVRAIIEGRKTQTRRVIKPQPEPCTDLPGRAWYQRTSKNGLWGDYTAERFLELCPYGKPGDRLWVRETFAWRHNTRRGETDVHYRSNGELECYHEPHDDCEGCVPPWRPSIHMPRWASRILLEVTEVRVERVQEIKHQDVLSEGIAASNPFEVGANPWITGNHERGEFRKLWDSINASRGHGWDTNPWVWVVSFRVIEGGAA